MAYTKKTAKTTSDTNTEKEKERIVNQVERNDSTESLKQENESLKTQMAEMKANMEMMMKQIAIMSQVGATQQTSSNVVKDIEVVSLTNAHLLITTTGRADGKHYDFNEQFESQPIPEIDLKEIVRAMPNTARNGYFYICDEEFVRNNGLYSSYRTMLNKTDLENLFTLNSKDFMVSYNNAPKGQKAIIESMVVNKKLAGQEVDANILLELQKITGKNYMEIEPIEDEEG